MGVEVDFCVQLWTPSFSKKEKIYGVQLLDLLITANENYFFLDSGRGPGNNSQLPVSLAGSH